MDRQKKKRTQNYSHEFGEMNVGSRRNMADDSFVNAQNVTFFIRNGSILRLIQ